MCLLAHNSTNSQSLCWLETRNLFHFETPVFQCSTTTTTGGSVLGGSHRPQDSGAADANVATARHLGPEKHRSIIIIGIVTFFGAAHHRPNTAPVVVVVFTWRTATSG